LVLRRRIALLSPTQIVELKQLKEDLSLAIKRASEAFREDPTRSSTNSSTFRRAQMADQTVQNFKRRIAEIEDSTLPKSEGQEQAFAGGMILQSPTQCAAGQTPGRARGLAR
jgi:hypothetical protein